MKLKKLIKVTIILILINICTSLSLESDSLPQKITTDGDNSKISVTTENFHRKQRQSRCIRCYEDGQSSEPDSRYGNNRYNDDGGRYGGQNRHYSSYPTRRVNEDSNWYNPYDRIDDRTKYYENRYPDRNFNRLSERDRYTSDRDRYIDRYPSYGGIRNEDRYHSRTFDQYDNRAPSYYNRYDSRIPYDHGQEYRGRYNERDRPYDRNRPGNYYNDRNYDYNTNDRNNFRDYDYDQRNYRPNDDSYRDQEYHPGRGYGNNDTPQRPNSNNFPYTPSRNAYLPNPQSPPRPIQSQNSSINSNNDNSQDYHNNRGSPDKSYAGDWSYANDRNKPGYSNTDKDKETNNYPYSGRGRPITGSYLLDRNSNIPKDMQNSNTTDEKNGTTTLNQNDNDKKNDVKNNN